MSGLEPSTEYTNAIGWGTTYIQTDTTATIDLDYSGKYPEPEYFVLHAKVSNYFLIYRMVVMIQPFQDGMLLIGICIWQMQKVII